MKIEHLAEICHEACKAFHNMVPGDVPPMMPWQIALPDVKLEFIRHAAAVLMGGQSPKLNVARTANYNEMEKQCCLAMIRGIVEAARPYMRGAEQDERKVA